MYIEYKKKINLVYPFHFVVCIMNKKDELARKGKKRKKSIHLDSANSRSGFSSCQVNWRTDAFNNIVTLPSHNDVPLFFFFKKKKRKGEYTYTKQTIKASKKKKKKMDSIQNVYKRYNKPNWQKGKKDTIMIQQNAHTTSKQPLHTIEDCQKTIRNGQ
ncbi:hypothetical protein RFI_27836 [Reticulomyxa filosa]|uniref:Uncharacterized protein n=1 Tax=Reticulomyxa filosa TaxID=46433 RepID=X6M7W1_RETFI|nr:hypothetical protein RFI_27836 [Reticulomyxa filosa]|eukprot:ETO09542.1 hypothetical protein RFI_27836 [Reticulomyxa filosa]